MTIRFAAARPSECAALARALHATAPLHAANDNGDGATSDRIVRAALTHFAEHGLSAAERARENAETAFFAGDREGYRWWLAICRALDRRMAEAVTFREGATA